MNPDRSTFVSADRLTAWVDRFAAAHQGLAGTTDTDDGVLLSMQDGAAALLSAPWPDHGRPGRGAGLLERLVSVSSQERRIGIFLVRRGGFAVGLAVAGQLVAHKVGGTSARSRGSDPAAVVVERATQEAARLFDGAAFEYLGTGGDRQLVDLALAVPALRRYAGVVRLVPVPVQEPKMDALMRAASDFSAVRICITDERR